MKLRYVGLALLLAGATALAQPNQQPPNGPPAAPQTDQQMQAEQMNRMQQQMQQERLAQQFAQERQRQQMRMRAQPQPQGRPPLERALGGPQGKWWDRPELAQRLLLTSDQQKKMDDVFQQARLKLIDLNASLEKEELIMEPLVSAEQPDEARIVAQIDKVAQARAELEKANARMLLGIRRVLTQDQWNKLKAETANNPPRGAGPQPAPQPRPGGPPRRGPGGPPPNPPGR